MSVINELKSTGEIIKYLNNNSPRDYEWSYENYFFNVTVPYDVLEEYLSFIESLVECKYTFKVNTDDTITLLFSI